MNAFLKQTAGIEKMEAKYREQLFELEKLRHQYTETVRKCSSIEVRLDNAYEMIQSMRYPPHGLNVVAPWNNEIYRNLQIEKDSLRFELEGIEKTRMKQSARIILQKMHISTIRENIERQKRMVPSVREIIRIPRSEMSKQIHTECSICFDRHMKKDVIVTDCGHFYGVECFMRWSNEHRCATCPYCRNDVERVDIFKTPQFCAQHIQG